MELKRIMLMSYVNPITDEIVGTDIIVYEKANSHHIASVRDFDEALEWTQGHDVEVDCYEEPVDMHGDTPVFNLFESVLYTSLYKPTH